VRDPARPAAGQTAFESDVRVQLQTLGCRLNEAELEHWARQFRQRGCSIATSGEPADLVVINTCAVTAEAVRKSRKLLRRAQRDNPHARLVVSGCAASLPEQDLGEAGIDLLVPNGDKDRLVEIAAHALDLPLMPATATEPAADALFARGRQRAFVKIQDGCRYQCTFCITTKARGAERSRPIADICYEINNLSAAGIREVVLTGVHAGGYGGDLGSSLTELIAAVLDDTDVPRVRLGSVEPWDLPDAFWGLFENPRFMPHLHLPLQSGADSVLKRMARRCKSAEFQRLVEKARAAVSDFNVTTDIIVGFPGETDDEWRRTMGFVERIGFGHLHIFAYSPRAGTLAADLPGRVPDGVKRERGRELHALGQRMKRDLLQRFVGRSLAVLVESRNEDEAGSFDAALAPSYLPVRIRGAARDAANSIMPVRILGLSSDALALEAAPEPPAPGRALS
jgi:threonylcarbamoyladenosine tRNA methylthiotransferase MtaB